MGMMALSLFFCLLVQLLISFVVEMFVPDPYLAQMVCSVVIALVFTLFQYIHRPKLKNKDFWINFFTYAIIFLAFDFLFWIIL